MNAEPSATPGDPSRCPLCGQSNQCAMELEKATGVAQGPCWCTQVDFNADLLARVPPAQRHQACICAACASTHGPAVATK